MKTVIAMLSLMAVTASYVSAQEAAPEDPMKALGMLFGGSATNPAVHHSELKALLPKEFAGMKRVNSESAKQNAMGISITYAQASYTTDESSIDAKITDLSGMGPLMIAAQYAWASSEIDRETETGYERTLNIEGFPAKETYDTENKYGEVDIYVDNRFMVEIDGSNIAMERMKELISSIDLNKLKSLQPKPAP